MSSRRFLEALAGMNPPAWERPKPGKGSGLSTDEQYGEFVGIAARAKGKDHNADPDRRPGASAGGEFLLPFRFPLRHALASAPG